MPTGQDRHAETLTLPDVGLYVPLPQGIHDDAPDEMPYEPGPQGVHEARELAPVTFEEVPRGHALHTVEPGWAL